MCINNEVRNGRKLFLEGFFTVLLCFSDPDILQCPWPLDRLQPEEYLGKSDYKLHHRLQMERKALKKGQKKQREQEHGHQEQDAAKKQQQEGRLQEEERGREAPRQEEAQSEPPDELHGQVVEPVEKTRAQDREDQREQKRETAKDVEERREEESPGPGHTSLPKIVVEEEKEMNSNEEGEEEEEEANLDVVFSFSRFNFSPLSPMASSPARSSLCASPPQSPQPPPIPRSRSPSPPRQEEVEDFGGGEGLEHREVTSKDSCMRLKGSTYSTAADNVQHTYQLVVLLEVHVVNPLLSVRVGAWLVPCGCLPLELLPRRPRLSLGLALLRPPHPGGLVRLLHTLLLEDTLACAQHALSYANDAKRKVSSLIIGILCILH